MWFKTHKSDGGPSWSKFWFPALAGAKLSAIFNIHPQLVCSSHEVSAEEQLSTQTMRSYQNFWHRMHGHSVRLPRKPLGVVGSVQSTMLALRLHLVQLQVLKLRPRKGPPQQSADVVSAENLVPILPFPDLRSLQGSPARLPCRSPLCEEDAAATPRHPCPALPAGRPSAWKLLRSMHDWNHTALVEQEQSSATTLQPLSSNPPHSSEPTMLPNPHGVAASPGARHRHAVWALQLLFAAC